jgi:protease I
MATGRPVVAICHGDWVDVDVVRGRRITSWPSMTADFRNAGAQWSDEQLVVDADGPFTLISSRSPTTLPAFCQELVAQMQKVGRSRARRAAKDSRARRGCVSAGPVWAAICCLCAF